LSAQASTVSVHGPPQKLLDFDSYADPDPDPAFQYNAGSDPTSRNNADPDQDPQPTFKLQVLKSLHGIGMLKIIIYLLISKELHLNI
jgi:hypothetical protein